jgi:hypothetical protein
MCPYPQSDESSPFVGFPRCPTLSTDSQYCWYIVIVGFLMKPLSF